MTKPSKFPSKFRRKAVDQVITSQKTIAAVANELGASENALAHWVRHELDAREHTERTRPLSESERDELGRLRQEVTSLRT